MPDDDAKEEEEPNTDAVGGRCILHMSLQGLALRIRPVCRCDKCDKLTWLSELLYSRSRLVI